MQPPDWKTEATSIIMNPMVAIMFWITMGLIVLMTFAKGSFFDGNIYEAFAALSQFALAVLVYRLTRQQFDHAQRADDRQARIAIFPQRIELVDEVHKLVHSINVHNPDEDAADNFGFAIPRIRRLFSAKVTDLALQFDVAAHDMIELYEETGEFEHKARTERLRVPRQTFREARGILLIEMNKEAAIEGG